MRLPGKSLVAAAPYSFVFVEHLGDGICPLLPVSVPPSKQLRQFCETLSKDLGVAVEIEF